MNNVVDLVELKALHGNGQRLLGVDLGTKTIGLAISDGRLTIAGPLHTIKRTSLGGDCRELGRAIAEHEIYGLVVGLPLNMDGSEGPRAQSTRAFVRNLRGRIDLPVAFWDERLSTVAAERVMIEADLSRKKRAERIDAAAARIILQGALDRMARL
jgi:putative pre-16S rRNA nuclease